MKPMEVRVGGGGEGGGSVDTDGMVATKLEQGDGINGTSAGKGTNANGASGNPAKGQSAEEQVLGTNSANFAKVVIGIAAYSLCSSSLLLLNKLAVTFLPSVSFVLICQFVASIAAVKVCGALGWIEVDALEREKVRRFAGVALLFACCLFTNVKALAAANVETLIVFRSLSPLAVQLCDSFLMDLEMPSMRTWMSLISIAVGAALYVYFDATFHLDSYAWVLAYFVSIVSEMVYVKHVISEVKMTTWGRVYFTNSLSIIPVMVLGFVFGDFKTLATFEWTTESFVFLGLSCAVGVGISYAGFFLRELISATAFTVVGVVNKIATTGVNLLIWDRHADVYGLASLMLCIVGGAFYQQPGPKRR